MERCSWPGEDPEYIRYHDEDWGVPVTNDKELFAKLILDGAQAGLSWITILKKRPAYYAAFDGLDPNRMAHYDDKKIAQLLQDTGIVRNRLKIEASVTNARAFLELRERGTDFSAYLWQFVDYRPKWNAYHEKTDVPAFTAESDAMSKSLRRDGFKFVGSTICYAFMQAVGMVQDHMTTCFRYEELRAQDAAKDWSQVFNR